MKWHAKNNDNNTVMPMETFHSICTSSFLRKQGQTLLKLPAAWKIGVLAKICNPVKDKAFMAQSTF